MYVRCYTNQTEGERRGKKKEGKTNMNIGGSDISLFLAQSHIDSLHSTEPLGYYSHTGLDNFTHLKLAHPFPIFLVCPAVSHTAAPGAPTMLKLALPSGIKKEKASVQSLVGIRARLHATHVVNTFMGCSARQGQVIHFREYKKA